MRILRLLVLLSVANPVFGKDMLEICIDYHCEKKQQVFLSNDEWQMVLDPFTPTVGNASSERRNIATSIGLFEQIVGDKTPTHRDLPENMGEDETGQLDCIAESTNTMHYLQWLERKGVLKWHQVGERVRRAPRFFDVHWGARIVEADSRDSYVVDSWYGRNGDRPRIQSLQNWLKKADE